MKPHWLTTCTVNVSSLCTIEWIKSCRKLIMILVQLVHSLSLSHAHARTHTHTHTHTLPPQMEVLAPPPAPPTSAAEPVSVEVQLEFSDSSTSTAVITNDNRTTVSSPGEGGGGTIVHGFQPKLEKFDPSENGCHQKEHVEWSIMVQISAS